MIDSVMNDKSFFLLVVCLIAGIYGLFAYAEQQAYQRMNRAYLQELSR